MTIPPPNSPKKPPSSNSSSEEIHDPKVKPKVLENRSESYLGSLQGSVSKLLTKMNQPLIVAPLVIFLIFILQLIIFYPSPSKDKNRGKIISTLGQRDLVLPISSRSRSARFQSVIEDKTTLRGEAMFMEYIVVIGETLSEEERQKVLEVIEKTFWEIHSTFNHFNFASELSEINRLPPLTSWRLSPWFIDIFRMSDQLHYITQGRYDPSINTLRRAWNEALEAGKLLTDEEVEALRSNVGWHRVEFNLEQGEILKLSSGIEFDFSAIAKGYGVDQLLERLRELGYESILVDWGGETRVCNHPDRRPWKVGINNPISTKGEQIGWFEMSDGAVATSGHSEQYWVVEDSEARFQSYTHLLNPKTFRPLKISEREIISCTVYAPNCALADALATSGLLFDHLEEAVSWANKVEEKYPSCEIFFLSRDGSHCNSGRSAKLRKGGGKIHYFEK